MSPSRRLALAAATALLALSPSVSRAVLFSSTADPNFNTTAPGGTLANSGWQYQGNWSAFSGTPISPQYFVTAKHVGGNIGQNFNYNGVNYTTTAFTNIGTTDLRLWKISGTFPTYAPLYTNVNSNGQEFVGIGRGTQRGADVFHANTNHFKGWQWGPWDQVRRWGENRISGYGDMAQKLLLFNFDAQGLGISVNEFAASTGDSGGGAFIKDGSVYKLAGIISGVSGGYTYNNDENETQILGSLTDRGGFYDWAFDPPQQVTDLPTNNPGFGVLSSIAANLADINAVINSTSNAPVWNVNANGNWSTSGNWWNNSIPNGVGAQAILGNIITTARTVNLTDNRTVGNLTFENANSYTIGASGGTLTINGTGASVNVNAGSHTIAAPVTLATNTSFNVTPANSTLAVTGNVSATNFTITKNGSGTLQLNTVRSAGLVIEGGKVKILPNGGVAGAVHVGGLSVNNDGALDLADNDLVVRYTGGPNPFQQKYNEVIEGFSNSPNPNLTGIVSSTSQANGGLTILALFDNAFYGVSDWPPGSGLTVSSQSVIGKYTYFGDANFDGQVSGDDYTVIDANLNTDPALGTEWLSGDMNLDGIVTGDDYTVIDANLGNGLGNPLTPASLSLATSNLNGASVPEPSGSTLLLAGAFPMLKRRRRRA